MLGPIKIKKLSKSISKGKIKIPQQIRVFDALNRFQSEEVEKKKKKDTGYITSGKNGTIVIQPVNENLTDVPRNIIDPLCELNENEIRFLDNIAEDIKTNIYDNIYQYSGKSHMLSLRIIIQHLSEFYSDLYTKFVDPLINEVHRMHIDETHRPVDSPSPDMVDDITMLELDQILALLGLASTLLNENKDRVRKLMTVPGADRYGLLQNIDLEHLINDNEEVENSDDETPDIPKPTIKTDDHSLAKEPEPEQSEKTQEEIDKAMEEKRVSIEDEIAKIEAGQKAGLLPDWKKFFAEHPECYSTGSYCFNKNGTTGHVSALLALRVGDGWDVDNIPCFDDLTFGAYFILDQKLCIKIDDTRYVVLADNNKNWSTRPLVINVNKLETIIKVIPLVFEFSNIAAYNPKKKKVVITDMTYPLESGGKDFKFMKSELSPIADDDRYAEYTERKNTSEEAYNEFQNIPIYGVIEKRASANVYQEPLLVKEEDKNGEDDYAVIRRVPSDDDKSGFEFVEVTNSIDVDSDELKSVVDEFVAKYDHRDPLYQGERCNFGSVVIDIINKLIERQSMNKWGFRPASMRDLIVNKLKSITANNKTVFEKLENLGQSATANNKTVFEKLENLGQSAIDLFEQKVGGFVDKVIFGEHCDGYFYKIVEGLYFLSTNPEEGYVPNNNNDIPSVYCVDGTLFIETKAYLNVFSFAFGLMQIPRSELKITTADGYKHRIASVFAKHDDCDIHLNDGFWKRCWNFDHDPKLSPEDASDRLLSIVDTVIHMLNNMDTGSINKNLDLVKLEHLQKVDYDWTNPIIHVLENFVGPDGRKVIVFRERYWNVWSPESISDGIRPVHNEFLSLFTTDPEKAKDLVVQ